MKAKEKTGRTQNRPQKGSAKSRGGGRLDGKNATTNPKIQTKNTSESRVRKAL
jgi:hypothetical protein